MLLGVSLDRVSQSGWMLWRTAALCSGHRGVSRDGLCSMERSCYPGARSAGPGGVGEQGLAGSAAPGPRGPAPAAANTSLHWHRRRDTRKPSDNRNTGEAARRASQQGKPSGCQQFTWTGFSGLWHLVSRCNFTRVCVRVCVFRFSINKKQQQEGSL